MGGALRDLPDSALCLTCGYLLRGLPNPRCPECGRAFDPADPESYRDPVSRGGRWFRPLRPPWIPYLDLLTLCALVILIWRSTVQGAIESWELVLSEVNPFGLVTLVALCIDGLVKSHQFRVRRALGRDDLLTEFNAHIGRWRYQKWLTILILVTLLYPWPAALRFWVSWPFLAAAVDRYERNELATPPPPVWIGGWRIERIWGRGQGFVWFQVEHDWRENWGIVHYSDPRSDVRTPQDRIGVPLGFGWYLERW